MDPINPYSQSQPVSGPAKKRTKPSTTPKKVLDIRNRVNNFSKTHASLFGTGAQPTFSDKVPGRFKQKVTKTANPILAQQSGRKR